MDASSHRASFPHIFRQFATDAPDQTVHGWRWHMFEEKREAVLAIEAAVLPLMTYKG